MHLGGAKQICDLLKDTKPKLWDHFMASHTPCEDVGRIAAAANCKTLVVNHFVPEMGFVPAQMTLKQQSVLPLPAIW